MCDIIDLSDNQPHIVVDAGDCVHVISVTDIRQIANGSMSLAEFGEPEGLARAMAIALIERL